MVYLLFLYLDFIYFKIIILFLYFYLMEPFGMWGQQNFHHIN